MTPITLIILTLTAIGTSILSAICGMGGGIVLLSVMTLFMPVSQIVPIHGIVQLISNSSRSIFLRKHIKWPFFFYYALGLPLGAFIGAKVIQSIENRDYILLLIALLIFYTLFKPKKIPKISLPASSFAFIGLLGGILAILVGAVGPFLAPFFLRDDMDKENIIATKSALQILSHLIKVPTFLLLGFAYEEHFLIIALLTSAALLGTHLGVKLLGKINEELFRKIFKTALFLAACRIVFKALCT